MDPSLEAGHGDHSNVNIQDIKDDFLRILSLENMKLTEKLVQSDKLQTSRIENMLSEHSHLLKLLDEQKRQNKVILEENDLLREQLKQNSQSTTIAGYNDHSQERISHKHEQKPLHRAGSNSDIKDQYAEKHYHKSFQGQSAVPVEQKNDLLSFESSAEPNAMLMKNIGLLKNHIMLLEQENEILRKNLVLSKQQEVRLSLEVREQQLQLQSVQARVDQITNENFDSKQALTVQEEEMTKTITRLTDINKYLVSKVKEYESAVDILTKELYKYTEAQKDTSRNEHLSFTKQDFGAVEQPESNDSIKRQLFHNEPSSNIQAAVKGKRTDVATKELSKFRSLSNISKENTQNQTDSLGTKMQAKNQYAKKAQSKPFKKTPIKSAMRKTADTKHSDRVHYDSTVSARSSDVLQKHDRSSQRSVDVSSANT